MNKEIFNHKTIDFQSDQSYYPNQEKRGSKWYPVSEENEVINIVKFQNINPGEIRIERLRQDMILSHANSNHTITIHHIYDKKVHANVNVFAFESLPQLSEPIYVYNVDIDLLATQFQKAQLSYNVLLNMHFLGKKQDCYDSLQLKCVLAYESIKKISDYNHFFQILGFEDLYEYKIFLEQCKTISHQILELKHCINTPLVEAYKEMMKYNLYLKPYTEEKIQKYTNIIDQLIDSGTLNNITISINKMLNSTELADYTDRDRPNVKIDSEFKAIENFSLNPNDSLRENEQNLSGLNSNIEVY
ncbi:hypothetical protein NOVO_07725 [Rickettsiales bacterium Ac37b]|nr:hypothetical protein NOVO_07725 [Rickettsiales bacterium Ac37b]